MASVPKTGYGLLRMRRATQILLIVTTGPALLSALLAAFLYAPLEAKMGVVQKIFYFHVPAAYTMYLSWAVCAVSSVLYLAKQRDRFDALAKSAAELTLLFAAVVMITGPLWGRRAWGAFWTWDPRLTASLLFTLIIVSYVLLRALASQETERRFAAALSILGACIVPFIHLSVQKWRGQHPTLKSGGLDRDMTVALVIGIAAFTLLFASLLFSRFCLERSRRRLGRLTEQAEALGALGGFDR
jgi:heme exporter protein C